MPAIHSLCLNPTPIPSNFTPSSSQNAPRPLQRLPLPLPPPPDLPAHVKERILCLEIMGVDSGRAITRNPSLLSPSALDSIRSVVSFLRSKGIPDKDMPRIFGMCPTVLTSDVRSELTPVFRFLSEDLGVPERNHRVVVNKCPRLLVSSVRDQLRPALTYLRRLGFEDNEAMAYQDPVLLVSSVERTLQPKLQYLVGLGMTREEAVEMVLRCPGLFTFSIENNFKPKYQYLVDEMGRSLEDLKRFPQYFAFSLEKRIKPRWEVMVETGVNVPLNLMLKSTDEEFRELVFGGKEKQPHSSD